MQILYPVSNSKFAGKIKGVPIRTAANPVIQSHIFRSEAVRESKNLLHDFTSVKQSHVNESDDC